MEKELMNKAHRPASRKEEKAASPFVPLEELALAEVKGARNETNVGDEGRSGDKKASGAYAITIPLKNPDDEKVTTEEKTEN